ncbi:MAG: hypothetical protein SOZ87_10660 [Candidatus Cryptobacteroides sp.]|nr:hypothetical protein [Candidatus Cryptobacteroides sp.]
MFHDETSCFIQDTPSDDFFKCVPRVGAAQSCLGGVLSGFTSSSGALADKFEKDSPFSVEVEHVSASGFYPLCGHDNEHSQEPLEPRGPIKPFDPSADDVKKVKEEVLEDGGGDEEHGVLLQENTLWCTNLRLAAVSYRKVTLGVPTGSGDGGGAVILCEKMSIFVGTRGELRYETEQEIFLWGADGGGTAGGWVFEG